ncbi:UPF0175 family protein [Candidatus Woesearchaeota archaeon]|nr:UPF0175 family protein [Candidatus Woesearchaeota archaeon]MBI2130582.1 UPF0175 family protein [Candidatus Woesearchaeota archaeon]MBI2661248.1 UPF0175 family protein [Candidatus Woesearchaeota archaeon]
MAIVYPLKLEEKIMPIIDLKSKEEHTNKAIVLKQLIYQSLEEYIIGLCASGRLSIGKAAEILDVSIYDMHEKARKKGIKLTASEEQMEKSRKLLEKLSNN